MPRSHSVSRIELVVVVAALAMGVIISSAHAAEIPNLTPTEKAFAKTHNHGAAIPASDLGPRRYVDPRITVRETYSRTDIAPAPPRELREQILSSRPSQLAPAALVNGGFETGNLNGWTTAGNVGSAEASACGAAIAAEAIVVTPGLLANANYDTHINAVNFGGFACRLGDETPWGNSPSTQSKCNTIFQDQVVPAASTNFVFAYAVIAQNPGHGFGEDPYFNIKLEDLTANLVLYEVKDYTTSYDPSHPCDDWCLGSTGVVYRRWKQVSLNLSQIAAGHNVRLSLTASDCSPSAHWGEGFLDVAAVVCPDAIAPNSAAISGSCGSGTTVLQWAAPSDQTLTLDGSGQNCVSGTGAAAFYDIRYSPSPIVSAADFDAADLAVGEQVPAAPGTAESFAVPVSGNLYFALRSLDASFNASAITSAHVVCPGNTWGLTTAVVGSGSVTRSPVKATYSNGEVVTITATPVSGYAFTGWNGDASGSTNPLSLTMNSDKSVTATFTAAPWTLAVTVSGSGIVTKNPNQVSYVQGQIVQLTAQPTAGNTFIGWSGDASGTTNPLSITMNANKSIVGSFTNNGGGGSGPWRLTVTTKGGGTVTRSPNQATYTDGTVVQLTATPSGGYAFLRWFGDVTGTTSPASITMTGDKYVLAEFVHTVPGVARPGLILLGLLGMSAGAWVLWRRRIPTAC